MLLADHTKFDQTAFARLAELSRIDVLITDRKPSEAWLKLLSEKNVEVLY